MENSNDKNNSNLILLVLAVFLVIYIGLNIKIDNNKKDKQENFDILRYSGLNPKPITVDTYIDNQGLLVNERIVNNYPVSSQGPINNDDYNNDLSNLKKSLHNIKNIINKDSKIIKFNLSNRPMTKSEKIFDDIKILYNNLLNIINDNDTTLKINNIFNIIELKTEDESKIMFKLSVSYNNIYNIIVDIEINFEKIYNNEDLFYSKNKQEVNSYLFKFDILEPPINLTKSLV
jgi:hypothetical protein